MPKARLLGGKPLKVGRKVATSDGCCCGGGGGSGACCAGGSCSIETAVDCSAAGGDYLGDGSTCTGVDCAHGACCAGLACSITTEAGCVGDYHGDGSTCAGVDCAQGACCAGGSCSITTEAGCAGDYHGDGTTCVGVDCTHGACCSGGACSITTEAGCAGDYYGDGTTCGDVDCTERQCCDTAFAGFTTGGKFLQLIEHTVYNAHTDPDPGVQDGCDYNADTRTITTLTRNFDGTCTTNVVCGGNSSYVNITHPGLEFANCNWVSDGAGGCHFVVASNAGGIGCGSLCVAGCTCTLITLGNTTKTCVFDFDNGAGRTCHIERTVTLSQPCNDPPGPNVFKSVGSAALRVAKAAVTGQQVISSKDEIDRRLSICRGCEFFQEDPMKCQKCGCFLNLKTRLETEHCPIAKW